MRLGFLAAGLRGTVALAASLTMTFGAASAALAADGTFVLASTYLIDRLYPHPQTAGTQLYVDVLFDPLVTVTRDGLQPRLAESWSFSEDGLTVTLDLREGVTYHDGTPFNAEVAKAALAYTLTPENAARIPPYMAEATVEATGEYQLTITLPAKAPEVLAVLSQYPMFLIDSAGQATTIGTGPFSLGEFDTRQSAHFVRNDNYWGGPAKLDAYEIRMFPEMSSALLSLEAREIDAVIRPPISEIARLDAIEGIEISSFPDTGNMMWGLNAREGRVTADVRVRKALDLAFDRERFVDVALAGVGTPTNVLWPPSSVAYSPEDESWRYDLDAARALIEEAGAAGSEIEFVLSSGVSQETVSFAPIYQADLAGIGINATIVDLDTSEWLDRLTKGEFDVYMTIYGNTGADPALAFTSGNFRLTNNLPGFASPEYSALEEAGRLESDPEKRIQIYRDLNAYVQEQAFALPFAQNPINFAHWDSVEGIVLNSINNLFVNDITAE
jgi:ABC-type transport system substrate-binding protein